MSLLEGIGLCSIFLLLPWTVSSIAPLVVAFEAKHLGDVPPGFSIWTRMPIVVVVDGISIPLMPRMISTEPTIVVVAMEFVAASMVIISTMVIVPSVMTVSSVMMVVVMRGMLLERGL